MDCFYESINTARILNLAYLIMLPMHEIDTIVENPNKKVQVKSTFIHALRNEEYKKLLAQRFHRYHYYTSRNFGGPVYHTPKPALEYGHDNDYTIVLK